MTLNNHRICGFLLDALGKIGIREMDSYDEIASTNHKGKSLILLGCHRIGSSLIESIKDRYRDFLVVDFSPEVDARLRILNIPFLYGDISHKDTIEETEIQRAKVIVSSISDDFLRGTDNIRLLKQIADKGAESQGKGYCNGRDNKESR